MMITRQFLRYVTVGITTNALGYLVYLLITSYGFEPKRTVSVLYVVGVTISFLGNKKWTFSHQGAVLSTGVKFFVAHFFGYLLNLLLLITFVDRLHYPHQAVQAVAIVVVALFLFVVFRVFVFPKTAASGGIDR